MRTCLASVLVVAIAGCGKVSLKVDDSGFDAGAQDAAADAAPANLLDPLSGTWTWFLDSEADPSVECTVTLEAETFDVYCPSGEPQQIGTDCMEVKDDVHITGTWNQGFEGSGDTIKRYEGTTCQTSPGEPAGVDIVEADVFTMVATHDPAAPMEGFLNLAYGVWQWTGTDNGDPPDPLGCSATFEPDEQGVAFRVECPEDPTTANGCVTTSVTVLEGVLTASSFAAEAWDEDRNEDAAGADCTQPPLIENEHTPMGATRM